MKIEALLLSSRLRHTRGHCMKLQGCVMAQPLTENKYDKEWPSRVSRLDAGLQLWMALHARRYLNSISKPYPWNMRIRYSIQFWGRWHKWCFCQDTNACITLELQCLPTWCNAELTLLNTNPSTNRANEVLVNDRKNHEWITDPEQHAFECA